MSHPRRWHDRDPLMRLSMAELKIHPVEIQDKMMVEIKTILDRHDPMIIERHVGRFTMKRRWYDHNPFTWMVINSLKFAPRKVREEAAEVLALHLLSKEERQLAMAQRQPLAVRAA